MIRVICQEVIMGPKSEIDATMGTQEPQPGETQQATNTIIQEEKATTLWEKDFDKFNCHNLGDICQQLLDGEPVFILRSQDKTTPATIRIYRDNLIENKTSRTVLERIRVALKAINEWRTNNKDKIKLPD